VKTEYTTMYIYFDADVILVSLFEVDEEVYVMADCMVFVLL